MSKILGNLAYKAAGKQTDEKLILMKKVVLSSVLKMNINKIKFPITNQQKLKG